jgi:hypothetical protein
MVTPSTGAPSATGTADAGVRRSIDRFLVHQLDRPGSVGPPVVDGAPDGLVDDAIDLGLPGHR